jgi:hypothetical protein
MTKQIGEKERQRRALRERKTRTRKEVVPHTADNVATDKTTPPATVEAPGAGLADKAIKALLTHRERSKLAMSPNEQKVLIALTEEAGDFGFCSFKLLQIHTGLDRKIVRRACRSLARKGFAEFQRGLWTEDGEPAGSGYQATTKGMQEVMP